MRMCVCVCRSRIGFELKVRSSGTGRWSKETAAGIFLNDSIWTRFIYQKTWGFTTVHQEHSCHWGNEGGGCVCVFLLGCLHAYTNAHRHTGHRNMKQPPSQTSRPRLDPRIHTEETPRLPPMPRRSRCPDRLSGRLVCYRPRKPSLCAVLAKLSVLFPQTSFWRVPLSPEQLFHELLPAAAGPRRPQSGSFPQAEGAEQPRVVQKGSFDEFMYTPGSRGTTSAAVKHVEL